MAVRRGKPGQPRLDMDLGQASFPPTGLGEGKKAVRTWDLELVRDRALAEEAARQREMFPEARKPSLSTMRCPRGGQGTRGGSRGGLP